MHLRHAGFILCVSLAGSNATVHAQEYPGKTTRMVVPFRGEDTDISARTLTSSGRK